KHCWAWTDQTKPNSWQWLDTYPQNCGWSVKSTDHEQIAVSVAQHPTSNRGDSYSGGVEPPHNQYGITANTGQGLQFAEQWKRVFELTPTPTIVMVTQWNEWMAQRFVIGAGKTQTFLGQTLTAGQTFFVDVYNQEYNRDIEPMKNGHTDNKYYQLVDNVRKYKGMPAPQASSASKTISIDGVFSEWTTVTPVFTDPRGDTYHRNEAGYESGTTYVNATGRNDITESRAAVDASNVYFYVKTTGNITPNTDPNWMLLFIDADKNRSTGWAGFDYVVNTSVVNTTTTTLKKWNATTTSWDFVANINYRYAQNQLELTIPRNFVGFTKSNVGFHFQWADNTQTISQAAFFINGDVAPDRRFRYDYTNTVPYIITGIPDLTNTEEIHSYPNPFNDQITITLTIDAEVQLTDMMGRIVFKGKNITIINTNELSPGIYLLRIISSTGVKEVKMEKQ
ncbi:MAG: T9SS type A sorting domain-containing protein, partial [Bacteroidetes bacterium]|nr:T9SS type A sorting domain-containing protein [Bacteroidota bacterium]